MRNLFPTLALAAALAPAALSAQSPASLAVLAPASPVSTTSPASNASPASPASPASVVTLAPAAEPSMIHGDVAGIRVQTNANTPFVVSSAATQGLHQGEGVALMAVGGAALVAGLLIGDDAGTAVALGGVAVGLVGLYEYVR